MQGSVRVTKQADGGLLVEIAVDGEVKWSRTVPAPKTAGPGRLDLSKVFKARSDAAAWARRKQIELV